MSTAARTLLDVVRLSTTYLEERGSESARLDAELLIAHALRLRRLDLYLQFDRLLEEPALEPVREVLRRRSAGEPVAYITGNRDFFGRTFGVTPAVLIPRPETETLVDCALRHIRGFGDAATIRVADLGTGSGCVAVTLAAEIPGLHIIATDVSGDALEIAAQNARLYDVLDRISFVESSWADAVDGSVDLVVSNPPYVSTEELATAAPGVRDFEPAVALTSGDDGLDAYRALAASLRGKVKAGGRVLLEIDARRAAAVIGLLEGAFPGMAAEVHEDLAGRARVIDARIA